MIFALSPRKLKSMKQQSHRQPAMATLFSDRPDEHDPAVVAALNELPGAVFAISTAERITFMNRAAMRISGFGYPEQKPPVWNEVLLPFKAFRKIRDFYEAVRNHKGNSGNDAKINLVGRDRSLVSMKISMEDVEYQGSIQGYLVTGEDITRLQDAYDHASANLDLYRTLAGNLPGINLMMIDRDRTIRINHGTQSRQLGFPKGSVEGKPLHDVMDERLGKEVEPVINAVFEGNEVSTDFRLGSQHFFTWSLPLKDSRGDVSAATLIFQNVTESKKAEREMIAAKNTAEEANRLKSQFIASISHEIRTPLNAIVGFSQQLNKTNLSPEQREFTSIIESSSEHLLSLVNDVLILSRIDSGNSEFEESPMRISTLITNVHNMLMIRAEEKGISLNSQVDNTLDRILHGDAFRIRQVIVNILSNAIKFTHAGYVDIKAFQQKEFKNKVEVRIDITDTGIGIARDKLESIFEQFHQADAEITRRYGGTGLGLTISKRIVEHMGGKLSVRSEEGMGSQFTILLPLKKGSDEDIIQEEEEERSLEVGDALNGTSVLLVDDDSVNRLLGKVILENFGCEVDLASGGEESIRKLESGNYRVVLLDLHMPEVSGYDVASHVRNRMKNYDLPIIAVTAAVMKGGIKKVFRHGMNNYLIKPFKEESLYRTLCKELNIQGVATDHVPEQELENKGGVLDLGAGKGTYNLEGLISMSGRDPGFIAKMLRTFIDNTSEGIRDLEQALEQGDRSALAEIAHKMLPSFRHLEVSRGMALLEAIKRNEEENMTADTLDSTVREAIREARLIISELEQEEAAYRKKEK